MSSAQRGAELKLRLCTIGHGMFEHRLIHWPQHRGQLQDAKTPNEAVRPGVFGCFSHGWSRPCSSKQVPKSSTEEKSSLRSITTYDHPGG